MAPPSGELAQSIEGDLPVLKEFVCDATSVTADATLRDVRDGQGDTLVLHPTGEPCRYDLVYEDALGARHTVSTAPGMSLVTDAVVFTTQQGLRRIVCASNIRHSADTADPGTAPTDLNRLIDGVTIECAASLDGVWEPTRTVVDGLGQWAPWVAQVEPDPANPLYFRVIYTHDVSFQFLNLVNEGRPPDDGTYATSFELVPGTGAVARGTTKLSDLVVEAEIGRAPIDQCHDAGPCDPETGVCSDPPKPDGTRCSDGDACTTVDACVAGVCVGAAPVACAPLDDCHDAGACDPATGACSRPAKPDATACDDGDACTRADACVAGVCLGADPVVCPANDACHDPGACDPDTGTCTNPPKSDGTACDDDDPCTRADACLGGACTGADPVTCTAVDDCHEAGLCDSLTGLCSKPEKPDGAACDDGDACTRADTCAEGACHGADPTVCTPADACHDAGTCDPHTGTCSNPTKADGAKCDDGDACTRADACTGGACTGGDPVVCAAPDACHEAGACEASSGTCASVAKPDGTPCDDGDAATTGDACRAGACQGVRSNPDEGGGCSCGGRGGSGALGLILLAGVFRRRRRGLARWAASIGNPCVSR